MNERNDYLSKPLFVLGIWALYHLVVWTIVPLLCNTCLPLDSIEAVMWGSHWQWGYDKHPPLSAWTPEIFTNLLGDAGLYLLSQLCIITAGVGIYKLARLCKLTTRQAVCAVLLLDTIYYYQFISVEFNVNILQMPFWAWGWFFGIDAIQNKRFVSWLGLGACVALGALTKYIAVFMLVPLFAAWWKRGELKQVFCSPGIYIAGLTAVILFLPHLVWMKNNEWMTITYGLKRGGSEQALWWHHLWHPIEFLLIQSAIVSPALLVAIIASRRIKDVGEKQPGNLAIAISAFVFIAFLSLFTGMAPVTMWAAPMPLALGIWLVPYFRIEKTPRTLLSFCVLMSIVFIIGYSVTYGMGPRIREKPHRVNYPGVELAKQVEERWAEKQSKPLPYIIADEFLGGIVNHYGNDTPAVMIRGNLERSAYLSDEAVRTHGALILWLKSRNHQEGKEALLESLSPDLRSRFVNIESLPDLIIPWPRRIDGLAGRYGLAYISPEE